MFASFSFNRARCCLLLLVSIAQLSPTAFASEGTTAADFLAGLRERGWHDVALEYLETADQDPLADKQFLRQVDYQRALLLATMAKDSLRDSERTRLYEQSIELLQRYAENNKDKAQYFDAMSRVAKILGEQARGKAAAAKLLPATATARKDSLQAQARHKFNTSADVLDELLQSCRVKLESLPKGALSHQDPTVNELRQKIVTVEAESRFLAANLRYEKADTYQQGSAEYRKQMEAAAKDFEALHKDYQEKLVGFYGRLFQGRCLQALKDWNEALKCYEDLVNQPISNPDFRKLVARAYRHRAECLMASGKLEQAIEECGDWLQQSQAKEKRQAEWLAVSFRLAEALQQQAAKSTGSEANRLESESRQLMREVAQLPGEFQAAAKAGLASGGSNEVIAVGEVETFQQAYEAGKQALDRMKSAKLAAKLAAKNNPAAQPNLEAQARENKATAHRLFQRAIQLADDEANSEELLSAQFYLCWFYWEEKQIYEAAILGNYIARNYPDSSYAASAAKVALVAREQLYRDEKTRGNDAAYESQVLGDLAQYVARRWPGSPDAAAATNLLIQIALQENRIAEAEAMLEKLPDSTRAAGQLSLGGALWSRYLSESQQQNGELSNSTKALKQRAQKYLASGFDNLPAGQVPSGQQANGVLYYLQSLLAEGKFDKAREVLEHPTAGPLALAEAGTSAPSFRQLALKAALQTYISVQPPNREKALQLMDELESMVGTGKQAADELTRIYRSLGMQLQVQLKELSRQGKKSEAQAVARAFEDLLERITSRGDAQDWTMRAWIAQTNLQLGEGLSEDEAEPYLKQAQDAFEAMLADVRKDPSYAPTPDATLALRKQLGDCLRARGQFDKALEQYQSILKERPNTLELQRSAALMFQQWGKHDRKPDKIENAIRGAFPQSNNRNLIWGWYYIESLISRQAQRVADNAVLAAKYRDLTFDARYNIVKSRLFAAQITDGAAKSKNLARAQKYLDTMRRLYPGMGGPRWQDAFEQLQKEIDAEG